MNLAEKGTRRIWLACSAEHCAGGMAPRRVDTLHVGHLLKFALPYDCVRNNSQCTESSLGAES